MIAWLFLLAQLAPGSGRAVADEGNAVRTILEQGALEPELPAIGLAARLSQLGAQALPELFTAFALGSGSGPALAERDEDALLQALASVPIEELRRHFKDRLETGLTTDERRALLVVLERVGTVSDLKMATAAAQAGAETRSLAPAVEALVTRFLRDDSRGTELVRRWILLAPEELAEALVRGASRSLCPEALAALAELLGFRPFLDGVLLPEIGFLAARAPKPIAPEIVSAVADALDEEDSANLREAALVMGRMEDFEAMPRLIELLDHTQRGVRAGARVALESLTGLRFGAGSARWLSWHLAESRWLERHGARLGSQLRAPSVEDVVKALGELSQHRFQRHKSARAVADVLHHPDPRVRQLACLTLARLGSSWGVDALQGAMLDPEGAVRAAARAALASLGVAVGEA